MIIDGELYSKIKACLPIPCVDLIVKEAEGAILLVLRRHPPAAGQWWFPGGRVHFGESRLEAARRKLRQECGLSGGRIREVGTFDVLLPIEETPGLSHGISTVFEIELDECRPEVLLDEQSSRAEWLSPESWETARLPDFVRHLLAGPAAPRARE